MTDKGNDVSDLKNVLGQAFARHYQELCKLDRNFSAGRITLDERENMVTATGPVSAAIALSDSNTIRVVSETGKRGLLSELVKDLNAPGFPLWGLIQSGIVFDFETALASIMEWFADREDERSFDEVSRTALSKMEKPKFIAYMMAVNNKKDIELQSGIIVDSPYVIDSESGGLLPFHKWCAAYFAPSEKLLSGSEKG